ncbi:MAG TPA: DUF4097 family beta strand repeat-containing protein [Gemmatimonadales bacterium]|nr:DUF4097 family beta strand repeat-containing protein [Gemmatimonadales bacterium]
MRRLWLLGALAGAASLPAVPLHAVQDEFRWSGRLAAGKVVEIKGVNGDVSATAAGGNEVEVVAVKSARRSDPAEVEIKVVEHANGVTICAVYPTPRRARRENVCAPGDEGHMGTEDNDVSVRFTVRVPAGVRFVGRTVNGDVEAAALAADVEAHTVNGGVSVSTKGHARASTVNGSIVATMGRAAWADELEFETVNGGITLTLPAELDTEVHASSVNGDVESDWPLTVKGRFGPRRVDGVIGKGGRSLHLGTVNGTIRLRKG